MPISTKGWYLTECKSLWPWLDDYPIGVYLLKVNNRNSRIRCEICSKLTIHFIVNFEHISHLILVFLLLTLNMELPAGYMHFFSLPICKMFIISLFEKSCFYYDLLHFSVIPCCWKALGICVEGFCIGANFIREARL